MFGDPAQVAFATDGGGFESPADGKVSWISDEIDGYRLVLVELEKEQFDAVDISDETISDSQRVACVGFATGEDGEDRLQILSLRVAVESGTITVDWGDEEQPLFEGFAILSIEDSAFTGS